VPINDFTEDDWFLISSTPPLIGAVISAADKSGIVGTVKEAIAGLGQAKAAIEQYPENQLIRSALQGGVSSPDGGIEQARKNKERMFRRMDQQGAHSPLEIKDQLLVDCRELRAILDEKGEAEEVAEYLAWAVDIGVKVAEAGREGGILGMGKGSISEREGAVLAEFLKALGVMEG